MINKIANPIHEKITSPDLLRVHVRTYGCQMNQADSETAEGVLAQSGLNVLFVNDVQDADMVLINTCSVREHAEDRVFGLLGRLKKQAELKESFVTGVMGCMAAEHRKELIERFPFIDFVCSQRDIDSIPAFIADALENKKNVAITRRGYGSEMTKYARRLDPVRAMVNITHGCDNFCTFCIVPFVRGREVSRPLRHILDEVKHLRDQGYKQIMFLGQNVNSYGKGLPAGEDFVALLDSAQQIDGIELIDFMTPHPQDASDELFELIGQSSKISHRFHLPLQSGSDRILDSMKRGYTPEEFMRKVDKLRKEVKDLSLTTDIIVGFPGETDRDFAQTESLMREARFDSSFIFKYSPRKYTRAFEMPDDVSKEDKEARNQILLSVQREMTRQINESYVGQTTRAIVAQESKKNANEFHVVTWNDKAAVIARDGLGLGDQVTIQLESLVPNTNTFRATRIA